ncbi:PREDICTED: E3 ubiquitin-protein ligase TRIM39-like [Nanorana parkeri]|uniref:E3 ubiquitin-protein ligase TRIM39-like n=1 Tax=Nanorana parkeri TaxID=125878 RepID=UPI00085457CE|nr:PREDICTED: E3 ubiquitin-protein ligase TRIM39-like [Nanorana parkeri]
MASAYLRKELDCSICLSTYTDPVNLTCGHNFCRVCIDRVLDTQEGSGDYSCPQCRKRFRSRPTLQRNITLRNIVENFCCVHPDLAEATGIFCTYCIHSPVPAVKSCLMCEASLCDIHLRVHSKAPEHFLTEPTTSMEKRKCSVHRELLKYYCIADAACICVTCSLAGEHQGHKVETLDEASEKKKKKLRTGLQKLITEREETERRVRSLQERRRKVQEKSSGVTERVTALFRDLRRHLEDLEKRVLREISRQEERLSHQLSDLIQKLEIKIAELSRKMYHIEEMCNMTDPLTVLQESDTGDLCDTEEGDDEDRERHDELLHDGRDLDVAGISHTLHSGLSDMMIRVHVYLDIYKASGIVLDVNTAHNRLQISEDMKTVSRSDVREDRPETPERFQNYIQVLSSGRFSSGRHYWEVDVSKSLSCRVGMCYPSIVRRGEQSWIGKNKKSWGLYRAGYKLSVEYNSKLIRLTDNFSSNRVRIYLDYEAGQLSFYDLCDPIRHLHTFTTTFTEPLHAVLGVGKGSNTTPHDACRLAEIKEVPPHDDPFEPDEDSPQNDISGQNMLPVSVCPAVWLENTGDTRWRLWMTRLRGGNKLSNVLQELITEREETERRVRSLQERRRKVQEKSAGVTERVTALFRDLRRHLEDLEKRVLREISRQEEQLSHQLSDLIQELEIKKAELSRKMRHIAEMLPPGAWYMEHVPEYVQCICHSALPAIRMFRGYGYKEWRQRTVLSKHQAKLICPPFRVSFISKTLPRTLCSIPQNPVLHTPEPCSHYFAKMNGIIYEDLNMNGISS